VGQPKQNKKRSASPDYPLYEKMQKKAPRAALFWMTGDRFYHLGVLLTMISIPFLFVAYTQREWEAYLAWAVGSLIAAILMAALGIYLKRESYKLAMRAGIDISKV